MKRRVKSEKQKMIQKTIRKLKTIEFFTLRSSLFT